MLPTTGQLIAISPSVWRRNSHNSSRSQPVVSRDMIRSASTSPSLEGLGACVARFLAVRVWAPAGSLKNGWSSIPKEIKAKGQHAYYTERFGVVELDGLFYGIPGEATLESWRSLAEKHSGRPDAYELVPKCNKFFTHTKRLIVDADFRERWSHFMTKCTVLGGFCPAILMQFNGSGKQCFKRSDETHATRRIRCAGLGGRTSDRRLGLRPILRPRISTRFVADGGGYY